MKVFDKNATQIKITSAEHAQMFLGDCADAAVSPVMPLHARSFLATCRERRLEATAIVAGWKRFSRSRATTPGREETAQRETVLRAMALGLVGAARPPRREVAVVG